MNCGKACGNSGIGKAAESGMITFLEDGGSPISDGGMKKKPDWFRVKLPTGKGSDRFQHIKSTLKDLRLNTVCQEAGCPNMFECWGGGTATFMIMGDTCTRNCRFCAVKSGNPEGVLDENEPENLAKAIAKLKLDYAVITSVDRDDLPDGGAAHFAECIRQCRKHHPELLIEVLTPDFQGNLDDVQQILDARPHVFGHNIETVERLQKTVRDTRAGYAQTLSVLAYAKKQAPHIFTKSAMMLGFGERDEEVVQTMKDLRAIGVDIFTIGQYLRPSSWHVEVSEFVPPEKFDHFKKIGEELGFLYVASGPFIRSSYRAGELFLKNVLQKGKNAVTMRA